MNDADRKAWLARHGINTHTVADDTGTHLAVDEDGMRALADLAPDPEQAHALIDQILTDTHE